MNLILVSAALLLATGAAAADAAALIASGQGLSPYGPRRSFVTRHVHWSPTPGKVESASPTYINVPRGGGGSIFDHESHQQSSLSSKRDERVLIIDVDNCLYSEQQIKSASPQNLGIEEQIIRNTHEFCRKHYNLTEKHSQELYLKYGSTVEGLRRTVSPKDMGRTRRMLQEYYHEVYDGIDMSALLTHRRSATDGTDNTGYSHLQSSKRKQHLAALLKSIPYPIYFASNSPKAHVLKVLTTLGLRDVPFEGIVTPDVVDGGDRSGGEPYPTKASPKIFYKSIIEKHVGSQLVLIDDSGLNLKKALRVGIDGLQVTGDHSLEMALAAALSHIESDLDRQIGSGRNKYEFSDVQYLRSKNSVDAESINAEVWQKLAAELRSNVIPHLDDGVLRIADVGAGLLSMLQMMVAGGGGKPSLFELIQQTDENSVNSKSTSAPLRQIHYTAYESNTNLIQGCKETLKRLGFNEVAEFVLGGKLEEIIFRGQVKGSNPPVSVTVHLRTKDFTTDDSKRFIPPNLVVGCCFADLFDPYDLAQSLVSFTTLCKQGGGINSMECTGTLVYFPITFTGTTQFDPAFPFGESSTSSIVTSQKRPLPSDTCAFNLYSKSLVDVLGHNLDENLIVSAMKEYGGTMICSGKSDWHIDPSKDTYLWNTMLYFFGTSGSPQIMKKNWNSQEWLARAREAKPLIKVSNSDLLFRIGDASSELCSTKDRDNCSYDDHTSTTVEEIQFQSPLQVGKTVKHWDDGVSGSHLGPNQVEISSEYSLISSGTELKIFRGMFEEAALDVNIKGMADASMSYPLAYGYSLVGRVTRCGSDVVDADDLLGRLVFTFSPHSTHVIADRDAIQVVPNEISAEDAIFMPSVETALSLVHDAHVRVGEKCAVYGQGLIGLLVTSILSLSTAASSIPSTNYGTVTVFDTISDRLAAASKMGASQALLPTQAAASGPFDVSIEVSGNARALQSAIDNTSSGGRIIVGSWYGNADVVLRLGIDFHRSHKTIKTSQVSEIPAELSALWSKQRRFGLTWELVKALRPSRLITKRVTLDEAQQAYESLENGKELAVAFRYNESY